MDYDKSKWSGPSWNAYVAAGQDRADRKARLEEVPEELKADVKIHVSTVIALRNWHRRMAKQRAEKTK